MLSKRSAYRLYRTLEIIPGALVWLAFVLAIALSFAKPLWVISFIIIFDALWLIRISYLLVFLLTSYRRFRFESQRDWSGMVKVLPGYDDIIHLIFLPTYKESEAVVNQSLESLTNVQYPTDKLFVVLCGEAKDAQHFRTIAATMEAKYGKSFFRFLVTEHPQDVAGEVAGKGSNTAYAGRLAKDLIDELKIPYEKIVVSSLDVDTVVHPQYLACLTYHYLTVPNPTRASYQPLAVYSNNVWESPFLMRVVAMSTTFWLMTEQMRLNGSSPSPRTLCRSKH